MVGESPRRPSRGLPLLVCLLALSGTCSLVCFEYASRYPHVRMTLDSGEYLWAAYNLRHGDAFYAGDPTRPVVPSLYSRRTPFYPAVIALLWSLWTDLRAVIWLQMLLSLLSGALLWWLLRFSGVPRSFRLVTVAAFLFYPANLIYTQLIMAGILLQSLLLLSLFFLAQFLKNSSNRHLWCVNSCLSLALLTKPVLMFFWIPNLAFHAWLSVKQQKKVLLIPALLPLLVTLGWSYRNFQVTGLFRFSSIRQDMTDRLARKYLEETEQENGAPNQSETRDGKASPRTRPFLEVARGNLLDLSQRQVKGMAAFFLDPGRFDFQQFSPDFGSIEGFSLKTSEWKSNWNIALRSGPVLKYLVAMTLFNLLLAVGFLLYPFQSQILEWKVFVVLLVVYVAVMSSAFGRSRYRLPVMPEILLAAAVVASRLRTPERESPGQTEDRTGAGLEPARHSRSGARPPSRLACWSDSDARERKSL